MRKIFALLILLTLLACEKEQRLDVPIEDIIKGPAKSVEVTTAAVVEPEVQEPVVEIKEVVPEPPKPVERGAVENIDVLLKGSSATVNVLFENGEEKFTVQSTDQGMILGILVGKYGMTEDKTRSLTSFLQEANTEKIVTASNVTQTATKTITGTRVVEIKAYSYQPEVLIIPAGTAVVWVHKDLSPHTVTSNAVGDTFNSGVIERGDTFTHNFFERGAYEYYSTLHPSMRGRIVVE